MPGLITIEQRGDGARKFAQRLRLASQVVQNLAPTFDRVFLPYMERHMKRQFESDGRYGGATWAGYGGEPQYRAFKRGIGASLRPLRWMPGKQERLAPSLLKRDANSVQTTSRDAASYGTKLPYAKDLERGGIGPFGEPYPKRKIISTLPAQRQAMIDLIKRDIEARVGSTTRPQVR